MAGATLTSYKTKGGTRWRLSGRTATGQFSRSFTDEGKAMRWQRVFDMIGTDKGLAALDADEALPEEAAEPLPVRTVEWVVSESIRLTTGLTKGTRDGYVQMAESWIYPFLGDRDVAGLDKDDIREWVNRLQVEGLAGNTIRHRHGILSAAFKWAVEKKYMTENPAYGVKLPDDGGIDMCVLEPEEIDQLLDVIDSYYRDFIIVLLGTGMRWGEATALTTNDITIHPQRVSIRVNKGWERVRKGPDKLGSGKTKAARRTINVPVGAPAYDALVRQMARYERGAKVYLFQSKKGRILRPANFAQTVWYPTRNLLKAEYGWTKHPRIHDLRHTAATLMLSNGAHVNDVQKILGHTKASTTYDLYSHCLKGGEQNALSVLGRVMLAAKTNEEEAA